MSTSLHDARAVELAQFIPQETIPDGAQPAKLVSHILTTEGLSDDVRECIIAALHDALPRLPDPVQALLLLGRLVDSEHAWASSLCTSSAIAELLSLFSSSPALGTQVIRYPEWIDSMLPARHESVESMRERMLAEQGAVDTDTASRWIRQLRYREFARIALADFLKLDSFEETTEKISLVADTCMQAALRHSGLSDHPVAVIALGKWGGLELNYSSDIDFLLVSDDVVSGDELHALNRKITTMIALLSRHTEDGFAFRTDARLRPEGAGGALIKTMRQCRIYYDKFALPGELQALIKARFGGGAPAVAAGFITTVAPYIYNTRTAPEVVLKQVKEMKDLIEANLKLRGNDVNNVKNGAGGIRDIEFLVQFLVMYHGPSNKSVREPGTLQALKRLHAHRIIGDDEAVALREDYIFLRVLEHQFQVEGDQQRHQLPDDPRALAVLARKMGYVSGNIRADRDRFMAQYREVTKRTRTTYTQFFERTIEIYTRKQGAVSLCPGVDTAVLDAHLNRLDSDYFRTYTSKKIAEHIRMAAELSEDRLTVVHAAEPEPDTSPTRCVTIVAYDFLGEFSKICGLLSAYGQNIVRGESFTYVEDEPVPDQEKKAQGKNRPAFYRSKSRKYRPAKRVSASKPKALPDQKIVCVCDVRPAAGQSPEPFPAAAFEDDLNGLLQMLKDGKFDEANETINLRVISSFKRQAETARTDIVLPPLTLRVDNESDDVFTILDIESPDQFMFLFEFTNVLAMRDYYIGKVEINTVGQVVKDRLFITTRKGEKIVEDKRIHELTLALTLIKQFASALIYAPNPHLALEQFSRMLDNILDDETGAGMAIIEQPAVMKELARLLGSSSYLWEDFLRMQLDHFLPMLADAETLDIETTPEYLSDRLREILDGAADAEERAARLNDWKDGESFRIDLRHLSRRVVHFSDFCRELSWLTDAILTEAYHMALAQAEAKFGTAAPRASLISALGKLGGYELGYASDIELFFVWDAGPDDTKSEAVNFFEAVVTHISRSIKSKRDGIFELDFRLRPYGSASQLAIPSSRFKKYYAVGGDASDFERQALIRMRHIAGSTELQNEIETHRLAYVFSSEPFDAEEIFNLRRRQQEELVSAGRINAKLSPGGLAEAEYFIQIQQIRYGHKKPAVRVTNTLAAAAALHHEGIVDDAQFHRFEDGYRFLRALINGLRIVRGNAKDLHIPDADSKEFQYLLRRLRSFDHAPDDADPWGDIQHKMAGIHDLFISLKQ